MEDYTIRNPTACEGMEHCHYFNSKILIEVMQSLTDVNADDEEDVEEDISRYIGFCVTTLKTTILVANAIFSHDVNDCIFQEILDRKIATVEKDSGYMYRNLEKISCSKRHASTTKPKTIRISVRVLQD